MENKVKQSLQNTLRNVSDSLGLVIYNICYDSSDVIIDQIVECIVVIGRDHPEMLQPKNVLAIVLLFIIALMYDTIIDPAIDTDITLDQDTVNHAQQLLTDYGYIIKN